MSKGIEVLLMDDSGNWEINELRFPLAHEYQKSPLIRIVRQYDTVTEQEAYNDAVKDINEIAFLAKREKKAFLSRRPVVMTNLKNGDVRVVKKRRKA